MNREQYLQMRSSNQISIELIYDYYNKFNNIEEYKFNIQSFAGLFQQFTSYFGFNPNSLFEYYDKEFKINSIRNKEGLIIKYY